MIPPTDDPDADGKFRNTAVTDPFPEVAPALLNSSDIYSYECATGMVFPFDERFLKSSSYAIRIGTKAIYWDGRGHSRERDLAIGENFVVPQNSIVFIKTLEKFRLPSYIAMRFNLKINNVHRGILLGTGPLVDPGFEGHLLIPLHNLTINDYSFQAGETFVWVEFTKISPHSRWDASVKERYAEYNFDDKYKPFPDAKKNIGMWDYINDAFKGPIRSSIPDALESAKGSAEDAARHTRLLTGATFLGGLGLVAALYFWADPVLLRMQSEINLNDRNIQVSRTEASGVQGRTESRIERLREEIAAIRNGLDKTSADNDLSRRELAARLSRVEEDLRRIVNAIPQKK
jgi:deoxycytidine triphosphate deaminase